MVGIFGFCLAILVGINDFSPKKDDGEGNGDSTTV